MNVEFLPVRGGGRAFSAIRSTGDTIRFRVVRGSNGVTFDADWFGAPVELAHSAWRQIASAWSADVVKHPCKKADCGGGRACLILTVAANREEYMRGFLKDILSERNSWLYLRAA